MALIDKLEAIAAAVRAKANITGDLTIDQMISAIGTISSSSSAGTSYSPIDTDYPITSKLTSLGNAIRAKTGGTKRLTLDEMPNAIRGIDDRSADDPTRLEYRGYMEYDEVEDEYYYRAAITGIGTYASDNLIMPTGSIYLPIEGQVNSDTGEPKYAYCTVVRIDGGAFKDCTSLTCVTFPTTTEIELIGSNAFYGCNNISKVVIPGLLYWNRIEFGNEYANPLYCCPGGCPLYYANGNPVTKCSDFYYTPYSFINCSTVEEVEVTSGFAALAGEQAFYGCPNLTTVNISPGPSHIESEAFGNCPKLTTINFPETLNPNAAGTTILYNGVFRNSNNIKNIDIKCPTDFYYWSLADMEGLEEATIYISEASGVIFANCPNLKKVTIGDVPNTTYSEGSEYWSWFGTGCDALEEVHVNWYEDQVIEAPWGLSNGTIYYLDDYIQFVDGEPVPGSRRSGFDLSYGLYTGTKTATVGGIGNCTASDVVVPRYYKGYKVTEVARYAFDGCLTIYSITLPETIEEIGEKAFSGTTLSYIALARPKGAISGAPWGAPSTCTIYYAEE